MSRAKIDRIIPKKIDDQCIAECISVALKASHKDLSSAIKNISRVTHISGNTIAKWYQAQHPPKAAHLLVLAAYYPEILRAILELLDLGDVWQAAEQLRVPQRMQKSLQERNTYYRIRGDIAVTPSTLQMTQKNTILNDRQLWFMEELAKGRHLRAVHIMQQSGVHLRTAKRDLQQLSSQNLIQYRKNGQTGWYELNTTIPLDCIQHDKAHED